MLVINYFMLSIQIIVTSVLPRLDEYQARLEAYNKMMKKVCVNQRVDFLDGTDHFPLHDRRLWSWKDGVHISEDKGIPILQSLLAMRVREAVQQAAEEAVLSKQEEAAAAQLQKNEEMKRRSEREALMLRKKEEERERERLEKKGDNVRSRRTPGMLCSDY